MAETAPPKSWDRRPEGWDRTAAGYQHSIRPLMEPYADDLVALSGVRSGASVLDVAAGPGTVAFRLVERVGPRGRVDAIDFSPRMIDLLEAEARRRGLGDRLRARVADGQTLEGYADHQYDLVTSQVGIIFFPDPSAGIRAAHRVLRPGGTLTVSSWAPMDRNPFLTVFLRAVQAHLPPRPHAPRPAVFALSEPGELEALASQAGFRDLETRFVRHPWGAPDAATYWRTLVGGSPAVYGFLEEAPPELRDKIHRTFLEDLRAKFGNGPVEFRGEARLVRAVK